MARLSPTIEDYLEAVAELSPDGGARCRDLAGRLAVHKSTVTAMLRRLASKGLVYYQPYGSATLTAEGAKVAAEVRRRHLAIRRFLTGVLGLDEQVADDNACRIEHAVDGRVVDRLVLLGRFIGEEKTMAGKWAQALSGGGR